MGGVSITARFGKDDREMDGLAAISDELIAAPMERRVVIGVIEVKRITTDYADDGAQTPAVKFVNIEALDGDDAAHARELMNKAFRRRTGRTDDPHPTLFEDDYDGDDGPERYVGDPDTDDGTDPV